MTIYPFIVKGQVAKVEATSYNNALDRVLYKNPNQFIKTKHAKIMSLIEAEDEAKKESKLNKKARYYVVTDSTGEADVSTTIKVGEIAHSVFVAGKKDNLTEAELAGATRIEDKNAANKPSAAKVRGGLGKILDEHKKLIAKNKTTENMSTAKKAAPAKKENKPAKTKVDGTGKATTIVLSDADWTKFEAKLAKNGETIRDVVRKAALAYIK